MLIVGKRKSRESLKFDSFSTSPESFLDHRESARLVTSETDFSRSMYNVRLTDHMLTYIQVNGSFALDKHTTVHRFTPVVTHCVENGYITPCTCAQDMATEGG